MLKPGVLQNTKTRARLQHRAKSQDEGKEERSQTSRFQDDQRSKTARDIGTTHHQQRYKEVATSKSD